MTDQGKPLPPPEASRRRTILVAGLLPDESRPISPALTDALHRVIGEGVYLFDGAVLDPFNAVVVAAFDDSESAVGALSKGLDDIREQNRTGPPEEMLLVRSLLFLEAPHTGSAPDPQSTIRSASVLLANLRSGESLIHSEVARSADFAPVANARQLDGGSFFPFPGDGRTGLESSVMGTESGSAASVSAPAPAPQSGVSQTTGGVSPALPKSRKRSPLWIAGISLLLIGLATAMFITARRGRAATRARISAETERRAVVASEQNTQADPTDIEARRTRAKLHFETGKPAEGVAELAGLLARSPSDLEALETAGAHCLGAGDTARFERLLSRSRARGGKRLHKPDLLMSQGKVDAAAAGYYDLEASDPADTELAWKIGRIAVLRRSLDIANLELAKLERSGSPYRSHLLRAYIATASGSRADVARELGEAEKLSGSELDFHTSSAELHAILNQPGKALAALEKSMDRSEPTAEYVLRSPLFSYLASDRRFAELSGRLRQQQEAVRKALAGLPI
ncbi:MAG TPA: hypothetical protein VNM92_04725 [Thermoanaerobaculia bacterium]|nr:hypothetical protein [Thermoanaerobaculia bacterium]